MTFLEELWVKFVNWISPILLPIFVCLWLIASAAFVVDQVRINGFGFNVWLPFWGTHHVDILTGYKAEAANAAVNYKIAKANAAHLQKALDDQTAAYEALKKKRAAADKATEDKLKPKIDALNAQLAGKDAKINALRKMVGNKAFGATEVDRAHAIIDKAYPAPGATP